MSQKTSTGVNFFGVHWIIIYMKRIVELFPEYKDNIFSIGSGTGYMECAIDTCCGIDVKCVDPEPNSYMPGPMYKQPKYKNVNEIEKQYVDNCILFINWATPEQCLGYDIDSILKLKPKCILFVGELGISRAANSVVFHEFLKFNDIETLGCYQHDIDEFPQPPDVDFTDFKYNINSKSDLEYYRSDYKIHLKFTLCCLSRSDNHFGLPPELLPAGMKNSQIINGVKYANEISDILREILYITPIAEQAFSRGKRFK